MRRLAPLTLLLAICAPPAHAGDVITVEAVGYAAQANEGDADAARRRATADALLQAALMGGAQVAGHTVVDRSVVVSDVSILRPVGRVLDYQVTKVHAAHGMVDVTIRARVGEEQARDCQAPHRLLVTAYAPQISVSPMAPAWTEPLAQEVANDLIDALGHHPRVERLRVTNRLPPTMSRAREAVDYTALTQGSVRMQPGEHGFLPRIAIDVVGGGLRPSLRMRVDMDLVAEDGSRSEAAFERSVALPGKLGIALGDSAGLFLPDHTQLAARLTDGVRAAFDKVLDVETCKPLATTLRVAGGVITAPVGGRNGLGPQALAFTADTGSVQMLEVRKITATSVTLAPLDPTVPLRSFDGRRVRFLEAG